MREEEVNGEKRDGVTLTSEPYRHVASTSSKPLCKTAEGGNAQVREMRGLEYPVSDSREGNRTRPIHEEDQNDLIL